MLVPDVIGRYRLGPRLGSGGFAVVWLAHDEALDTEIAIKVMADNWADRMDLRERFLAEARMLRRASSSRIVQVFDIGELPDGRPYFVMEYADRGTLADRVKAAPMALVEALRTTAEVARGAAELHRAGIVHRDLKPSNVLIRSTPDGGERLLIADLGVAKSLAQASGLTMSVGSAGYMAPEQSGPNSGVEVRADVYSLGAIAYRLITGEVPGLPGFVRLERPELPPPVRRVLQQALEVQPEKRWPDATVLADRLDELAGTYAARPARRHRPGRGRRVLVAIAVVAVLAGLGGAGFGYRQWRRPVPVQDAHSKITVEVPRAWARQLTPDGWDPGVLALSGGLSPGLLVADDVSAWNALGEDVNGVFVGRSDDPDLVTAVSRIKHPDCTGPSTSQVVGTRWAGSVRSWTDCGDSARRIDEIGVTSRADRSVLVYLQIRQDGAGDASDSVLAGLRVSAGD